MKTAKVLTILTGLVAALVLTTRAKAQEYREGNFYIGHAPYQMYVEYRLPLNPRHETPIVMFHGANHTGAGYVQTPDGRDGWGILFARAGRKVYIVDWPGHGRSPMPQDFATMSVQKVIDAGSALIDKLGPVVILTHSMSGPIGWKLAEASPNNVKAVIGIAPGGPANNAPLPDAEQIALLGPLTGQIRRAPKEFARKMFSSGEKFPKDAFENYFASLVPESERIISERFNRDGLGRVIDVDLTKLSMPKMIVTGDQDLLHPPSVGEKIAKQLKADWIYLPTRGLTGHGHMLMLDQGSDKIATILMDWLEKHKL